MPLNPATDMLVNAVIIAIFAAMKASGMSEEEAKAKFQEKVAQVEQLPQLPMDI
jgi:hypothetical protein